MLGGKKDIFKIFSPFLLNYGGMYRPQLQFCVCWPGWENNANSPEYRAGLSPCPSESCWVGREHPTGKPCSSWVSPSPPNVMPHEVSHWGPGHLSGSYKAENMLGPLWLGSCKLPTANCTLWLQLQNHNMEARFCLEHMQLCHRKGVSGGAFHGTAQVNLLSVSWSEVGLTLQSSFGPAFYSCHKAPGAVGETPIH